MKSLISAAIRYIGIMLIGFLLICAFSQPSYAVQMLAINFPEGPLSKSEVEVRQSGDLLYVDLNGFATALNLRTYISSSKQKIQYTVGSFRIIWTADNAFVIVGDKVHQLPAVVVMEDDRYWAPLDAFLDIFLKTYPATIKYDRYLWTLTILPGKFDVYAITYDLKENGTLIRISCSRKFDISGAALRNKRLSLSLMEAKINREAFDLTPPVGAVKSLIVEELPESVQLTFKLNQEILEHTVWQEDSPYQINISLVTKLISTDPDTELSTLADNEISSILENEQQKWKIDCVVIDPGHGGKDPGAIGAYGLLEKTVTLDIALRVKKLLEKETNLRVVLTRDDDRFIPLKDRTKFANKVGGKLFVSIHTNASKYKSAHGFETYFLKPARNERAMDVALRENAVIKYEESKNQYQDLTEENYILLAMAQAEFARESETLAALVQNSMKVHTQHIDRGVDQAGFYVLVGASMPAILVEVMFISNKHEAKKLKTKKFRQKIARAITESIIEFKKLEERKQGITATQ